MVENPYAACQSPSPQSRTPLATRRVSMREDERLGGARASLGRSPCDGPTMTHECRAVSGQGTSFPLSRSSAGMKANPLVRKTARSVESI